MMSGVYAKVTDSERSLKGASVGKVQNKACLPHHGQDKKAHDPNWREAALARVKVKEVVAEEEEEDSDEEDGLVPPPPDLIWDC